MTARFKNQNNNTDWDELILANSDSGNSIYSFEAASVKSSHGWIPRYIMADKTAILTLEKSIPLLGKFWYLPKGPGVITTDQLTVLMPDLVAFAKKQGVFSVKVEPELLDSANVRQSIEKLGGVKTFSVQPNASTVLIDLAPSEDEVMAAFNQKGRHAIRRAQRDGVTTRPVDLTEANMKIMYALLAETAAGQWKLRSYDYFKQFWQTFADAGHGQLFFAEYGGEVVAASFGLILGTKGTYKDGASVRKRTVYGASHLLQWEMMTWMKAHGALHYDLCGAPPSSLAHDESHRLYNIGRFKTSFNKQITDYVGCYEFPVRAFPFKLWKLCGERIVLRLHSMLHHTEWY